ncbi:hypothetical protein DPEC_G00030700 [Dallia pectoralis]|uniref:Uncharacterized protein n=1 Tax=Dallia pectoralis TaxID=75939 RepID=A0ACC2HCP1_DALPE|nr:hypothetical protein DPEC_G00030700 [Dallia pectoralis]
MKGIYLIHSIHLYNKNMSQFIRKVFFYSMDDEILKRMVTEQKAIDWSTYFLLSGLDKRHESLIKEVSASRGANMKHYMVAHLMTLSDPGLLPQLSSDIESKVSSLNESHVDLVNQNWKYGGGSLGYRYLKHLINHYPSGCITDKHGQPVSWVLLYDHQALGVMYTLPEYRGQGLAKALVNCMSRRLYAQGYPVYCYIAEGNTASHSLCTSMGFTEDPQYRAAWYKINSELAGPCDSLV